LGGKAGEKSDIGDLKLRTNQILGVDLQICTFNIELFKWQRFGRTVLIE